MWNKKQIRVYELICDASKSDEEKVVHQEKGTVHCSPNNVVLYDQLLFVLENGRVQAMSFQVSQRKGTFLPPTEHSLNASQGTSRQSLNFAQNEGEVNIISSNASFLVMGSNKGYIKVYDISRR